MYKKLKTNMPELTLLTDENKEEIAINHELFKYVCKKPVLKVPA